MSASNDAVWGWTQRSILLGMVSAALLGATGVIPIGGEILLLAGVVVAWWLVPGFWRAVVTGGVGGALAGVLILAPGFRIAMRVVAIIDPIRTPEFSWDGTFFIILGIGLMGGGIVGILGNFLRLGTGIRSSSLAGLVSATAVMGVLFAGEEIRAELFELGAGGWFNIPMFGLIALIFGVAAVRTTIRLEKWWSARRTATEAAEVPA